MGESPGSEFYVPTIRCTLFHLHVWCLHLLRWNRVFRNVGTQYSEAGDSPKRKNAAVKTWRTFEIKTKIPSVCVTVQGKCYSESSDHYGRGSIPVSLKYHCKQKATHVVCRRVCVCVCVFVVCVWVAVCVSVFVCVRLYRASNYLIPYKRVQIVCTLGSCDRKNCNFLCLPVATQTDYFAEVRTSSVES